MIRSKARFILFWFLLLIGIFGWVRIGAAEELRLRVITADATIRLEPGPESTVVSKVKLGAVLNSISKSGEWYGVDLPPDEDGYVISGFVHQSQVEVIGGAGEPAQVAEVIFDAPRKIRVNAEKAEIKEKPVFDSREMGQAPLGTELNAVAMAGEWYKVEVASGIYGYIHQLHVENVAKPALQEYPVQAVTPAPQANPQDPAPAVLPTTAAAAKRNFTLKLTVGFGGGFKKIDTHAYTTRTEGSTDTVTFSPGGGGNFGLDFGYYFTKEFKVELGIAFQSSGVFVSSDQKVSFSRIPLILTLLYEFPSVKKLKVYAGGGAGYYTAPKLTFDVDSYHATVEYDPSFGLHGLVGAVSRSKSGKWFYFGEVRYVGVFNYKASKSTESYWTGYLYRYSEFSGHGIFFLFGIGLNF